MFLDKSIGHLMDYLEEKGWMENSIVVVASDNGGDPSEGGSNYPLRGKKATYWEGGCKARSEKCIFGVCMSYSRPFQPPSGQHTNITCLFPRFMCQAASRYPASC